MMRAGTPAPSEHHRAELLWFCAWTAVGVGLGLGVSALGVLAVPLALLAAAVLLVRHHAGRAALGVLLVALGAAGFLWHRRGSGGEEARPEP